jgi:hypothetical protein
MSSDVKCSLRRSRSRSSRLPKVADELAVDIAAVPMLVLQVSKNISFFVFSFSVFDFDENELDLRQNYPVMNSGFTNVTESVRTAVCDGF